MLQGGFRMKQKLFLLVFIMVVFAALFVLSPIFHPIVILLYKNPILLYGAIILTLITILSIIGKIDGFDAFFTTFILIPVGIILLVVANVLTKHELYKINAPKHLNNINELTITKKDPIRILPRKVAYAYLITSIDFPRYTIDNVNITAFNDRIYWYSFIEPDGLINSFILKSKGVFLVPVDTVDREIISDMRKLEYSPGQLITDNLYWKLYKFDYFADYGQPRVVIKNKHIYIIVPQIKYRFKWFYTVPYWAGAVVIDEKGNIKHYKPEELLTEFKDAPIYPMELAREIIESQNYWKDGVFSNIMNILFYHEDMIELPDCDSNCLNKQPYLIMSNKKLYWLFAVEPFGKAYGISTIFVASMEGKLYKYKFKVPHIGPEKGKLYVEKALPTFDWNRFEIVEPLPIVKGDKLYWRYIVIPKNGAGIAKITLVNSKDGNVLIFDNKYLYKKFLLGKNGKTEDSKIHESTIKTIIKYVKNGNTHWLIVLNNGTYYDYSAEDITIEQIIDINNLKPGSKWSN